jgi:hypothetical protein
VVRNCDLRRRDKRLTHSSRDHGDGYYKNLLARVFTRMRIQNFNSRLSKLESLGLELLHLRVLVASEDSFSPVSFSVSFWRGKR